VPVWLLQAASWRYRSRGTHATRSAVGSAGQCVTLRGEPQVLADRV
jgi:hypothetical protein